MYGNKKYHQSTRIGLRFCDQNRNNELKTNRTMKQMKIWGVLILMILPSVLMAEESPTHLFVWAKDGSKVGYALAENPKITFTETDMIIACTGEEISYPLNNMERFTYESDSESSIRNIQTEESPYKLDGESLLFPNLKSNTTVFIYTLDGTQVFKKTVRQNGEYAFPLSNLNAGVYMVNVNGLTYKIVKR